MTRDEVASLVSNQMSLIKDEALARELCGLLVSPYPVARVWEYGGPGETRECWIVMASQTSTTAIAYCADGFGDPWGLISSTGPDMSMGIDAQWFTFLEDAFRACGAWSRDNPPDYEVR